MYIFMKKQGKLSLSGTVQEPRQITRLDAGLTDLVVMGRALLEGEIYSTVNSIPLHTALLSPAHCPDMKYC